MSTARKLLRCAYADPPYPGEAKKHYSDDPQCAEVDHAALIARLDLEYPDGWALSTKATLATLRDILMLCPPDARLGVWAKTYASMKPGVNPGYFWEPVIFSGGRKKRSRKELTVFDWIAAPATTRRGVHGAKPDAFSYWVFQMLGLRPGDTLDDLFPGSHAVSRAWRKYQALMPIPVEHERPSATYRARQLWTT